MSLSNGQIGHQNGMFDARRFLKDHYSNAQHTATSLRRYGFPVSSAAATKWFQRGSVPGLWLAVLIAIKEIETGSAVRVAGYLSTEGVRE